MMQLAAMITTLVIETPLIIHFMGFRKRSFVEALIFAATPTLITHPILWHASQNIPESFTYFSFVIVLEFGVVIAEALILFFFFERSYFFCLWVSFIANCGSAIFGQLLWVIW